MFALTSWYRSVIAWNSVLGERVSFATLTIFNVKWSANFVAKRRVIAQTPLPDEGRVVHLPETTACYRHDHSGT